MSKIIHLSNNNNNNNNNNNKNNNNNNNWRFSIAPCGMPCIMKGALHGAIGYKLG